MHGVVARIERLKNSASGNPRFAIHLTDGRMFKTAHDSGIAFYVSEGWAGRHFTFTLDNGQIVNMEDFDGSEASDAEDLTHSPEPVGKSLTFSLTITLGNDAMQNYWDVSDTLDAIQYPHADAMPVAGDGETIRDASGNTVGNWSVL